MRINSETVVKAFGTLLKRRRTAVKLSQDELSERSGLDRTYISGMERGRRNPSLLTLNAVAAGLDVQVAELLSGLEQEVAKLVERS